MRGVERPHAIASGTAIATATTVMVTAMAMVTAAAVAHRLPRQYLPLPLMVAWEVGDLMARRRLAKRRTCLHEWQMGEEGDRHLWLLEGIGNDLPGQIENAETQALGEHREVQAE